MAPIDKVVGGLASRESRAASWRGARVSRSFVDTGTVWLGAADRRALHELAGRHLDAGTAEVDGRKRGVARDPTCELARALGDVMYQLGATDGVDRARANTDLLAAAKAGNVEKIQVRRCLISIWRETCGITM